MSGRMQIDTDRVASLARDLADAADSLLATARAAVDVPPLTPSTTTWADATSRHDAGVAAVTAMLTDLAERASSVADALVAAVATTTEQDVRTARSVRGAAGDLR